MAYIQLIEPNINIGARAGMCLEYVDNAVNAPKRTATAQIAYETAKGNWWVSANTEYPRNVWFVLFWSIDNNDYAGLGHVALAFVDDDGNMQIHDSEVHRGARQPYTSLEELSAWFGSVGTRLTYLGWSIGVDGIQIVGEIGQDEQKQLEEIGKEVTKANKGELSMFIAKCVGGDVNQYVKNGTFVLFNLSRGTYSVLNGNDQVDAAAKSHELSTGESLTKTEMNYMVIFHLIMGSKLDYRA